MSTALKGEVITQDDAEQALNTMAQLNSAAAELSQEYNVNGCTDITGFGLLGHAYEMAAASKVGMNLYYSQIPFLDSAKELAAEGMVPGGAYRNRDYLKKCVEVNFSISEVDSILLYDPQTSGGLLISLPAGVTESLVQELNKRGITAEIIGEVTDNPGILTVL
ncbi:MAG: hypothetical protein CVU88_01690 [Firmicutes bacterium HGW-Firmicutes-13]|nr:MAG: hypothetical protein CVU88_01690 [Firmicutes bacterium HGW-Firmicutes-13]